MTFPKKITKEEILQLPEFRFEGKVHVISNEADIKDATTVLAREKILGFDTETKPAFRKGQYFPTALVQFATQEEAFLFRINHLGPHYRIYDLMEDVSITKIGVALRDDLVDLNKIRRFEPDGFIDLNEVVKDLEFENMGARNLTGMILGKRINKAQQTSNWENEELTKAQIHYAATDAWVCREIYQVLSNKGYLF